MYSVGYDAATTNFFHHRRAASHAACFLSRLVGESAFASQLIEAGIADSATLARMSERFMTWGRHPNAFAAEAWGEAVAWRT